ncbi:hypothetical protein HZS_1332 [Henneguya salminicola]|nr:hypothetical protein HZS_1332 [Henneguya salminicola]
MKPNSSFHTKGIWIYEDTNLSTNPSATIIGSSNYSERSFKKDVELDFIFITENSLLQSNLSKEVQNIQEFSQQLTEGKNISKIRSTATDPSTMSVYEGFLKMIYS